MSQELIDRLKERGTGGDPFAANLLRVLALCYGVDVPEVGIVAPEVAAAAVPTASAAAGKSGVPPVNVEATTRRTKSSSGG